MAAPRRATARAAALPARRPLPSLLGDLPSPRSLAVGFALLALAVGRLRRRARDVGVRGARRRDRRRLAASCRRRCRRRSRPSSVAASSRSTAATSSGGSPRSPACSAVRYDRAFPHTLRVVVTPERPVLLLRRGKAGLGRLGARPRPAPRREHRASARSRASGCRRARRVEVDAHARARERRRAAATALAPLAGGKFPAHVRTVRATGHGAHARARARASSCASATPATCA